VTSNFTISKCERMPVECLDGVRNGGVGVCVVIEVEISGSFYQGRCAKKNFLDAYFDALKKALSLAFPIFEREMRITTSDDVDSKEAIAREFDRRISKSILK